MLRRGSITVEMAKAGPQFCSEFSRAYLDPLQAADIGRVPVSGRRIHECSYHIQSARERAWAALEAVGGLASPGGCCIWSVVAANASSRNGPCSKAGTIDASLRRAHPHLGAGFAGRVLRRLTPICDRVPRNSPRLIAYLNTRGLNDA
jgi:hypothetical protein